MNAGGHGLPEHGPPPDVILGPCDDMRAEVFVRVPVPDACGRPRLEGTLSGPTSRRGVTLPATFRFTDLGPGPTAGARRAVARAVCTEPAYWTPEQPARYRLDVRLLDGDDVVARTVQDVGLRRLGIRGRSCWFDGRRWVPRIVAADPTSGGAATVCAVQEPGEELLAETDAGGIPVACILHDVDPAAAAARIARWSAHPSAMLAILPAATSDDEAGRLAAATDAARGTVLLGMPWPAAEPPPAALPHGIQFVVARLAEAALPHPAWRAGCPLPLVAWRETTTPRREECDRLQADLAAWGVAGAGGPRGWDWAGYAVAAGPGARS